MLEAHSQRCDQIIKIACRALAIIVVTSLLVAPRLTAVMEAKTGQRLNRILFQALPPNSIAVSEPTKNARDLFLSGFTNLRQATTFSLALVGGFAVLLRRRNALWFMLGWAAVFVAMNPTLVGINRAGLIDRDYLIYAFPTAIAVMAGLAVGLGYEAVASPRSFAWNGALLAGALFLCGWGAFRLQPLPELTRFVLQEDLPAMKWIKANVPENEKIAGRAFFHTWIVLGHDAVMWVPYFTRHRTNHMLLAAALERGPIAEREKSSLFTADLYTRDMSTPESAAWMQEQGYRWFYFGASAPAVNAVDQLARNPALELVFAEGAARLYRVR